MQNRGSSLGWGNMAPSETNHPLNGGRDNTRHYLITQRVRKYV